MNIVEISYRENSGAPGEWVVEPVQIGESNLIVGKNATGKSRFLTVVLGLSKLIDGQQRLAYDNGEYDIRFNRGGAIIDYKLAFEDRKVVRETLFIDGNLMLARDSDGSGMMYYSGQNDMLKFSVPEDVLVLTSRRDRLQHPYIEYFHEWASRVRYYQFGTSLGREQLSQFYELVSLMDDQSSMDPNKANHVYSKGFHLWAERFDQAIIADMCRLGYPCHDIGIRQLDVKELAAMQVGALFVSEDGLAQRTFQTHMSQGMFRALCMVIHLNFLSFSKTTGTVLIDDIGEGLDFERSSAFVALLTERCTQSGLQLLMTTNDRFVMNSVPLSHWCILDRQGSVVNSFTEKVFPDLFRSFKFLGLNNFDFFASSFFKRDSKEG